jgi:hypothetical protein
MQESMDIDNAFEAAFETAFSFIVNCPLSTVH